MNKMYEKELETALFAVNSVRSVILDIYNSNDIGVEIKSDDSPVTKADKAADALISKILKEAFPDYGLLTEESQDNKERLNKDLLWIVDPVDGTKEFVAHNGEFSVNIGLSYKHEAVLGVISRPTTGEIWYGIKGVGAFYLKDKDAKPLPIHVSNKTSDLTAYISRNHSSKAEDELLDAHKDIVTKHIILGASLKGCAIASGKGEVSYRTTSQTKEWDTCALQAIVEAAGGIVLTFKGDEIRYNREDVYNHDGYIILNRKENLFI